MKVYGSWKQFMENRVILYMNDNTGRSVWLYGDMIIDSDDLETVAYMSKAHYLLRQYPNDPDLIEAVKFILKRDGTQYLS